MTGKESVRGSNNVELGIVLVNRLFGHVCSKRGPNAASYQFMFKLFVTDGTFISPVCVPK